MPHRPPHPPRTPEGAASTFDRVTLNAFMLAVTVAAAALLAYGPAAAVGRLGDALSTGARAVPVPDEAAWRGMAMF